ncbi:MAG: hypothetical protein M3389_06405, partial [Actinomycetota bacterium]|nr:hypothetical protein [Actinomycetota bacterium]
PAPPREAAPPAEAAAPAPPPPPPPSNGAANGGHDVAPVDLGAIRDLWPAVLDTIRGQNGLLHAVLVDARPCDLRDEELVIAFTPDKSFLCRKAEDQANRQMVAEAVRSLVGRQLRVSYELREAEEDCAPSAPGLSDEELVERFKSAFEAEEIVPDETEEPA